MKNKIAILLLILLGAGGSLFAQIGQIQNPLTASLNAQDAGTCSTANSFVTQQLPTNASTTTLNLAGTFTATITVRESNNGGASWATAATLSAAGTTTYATNGFSHVCVDVTAYTSGTVQVSLSTGLQTGLQGPAGPAGVGGGACSGANCFSPVNYPGWHGNGREVLDATWSGGGSTITCPNNDCNFSSSMNGYLCWAMPQSMQAGPATAGTFTFISAQSASCTAAAVIGSAAANGVFNWGQDDTPAWISAVAALYTQPKCGAIVVPAARSLISQGLSYTGAVVADCAINVTGSGYDSNLVLEPQFNAATVTNSVGCTSLGCFWNTSASTAYLYFNVTGTFQSLSGRSTAPASALFTIGPGSYAIGVNLFDWATAASNTPQAANINGAGPFGLGFAITNFGDGNIWNSGLYGICENCGGTNVTLKVIGASLMYDYSGTYNGLYANGGELHGFGSLSTANSGGFGAGSCDRGSFVYLDGAKIGNGTPGSAGIGFQFNNLGGGGACVLHAKGTLFNGGGTGAAINVPSGVTADFFDDGGNTYSSPFLANAGTFRNHHRETGTCVFAAATTCTVNFAFTYGNSTLPTFVFTPINPGAVTFTVTALSTTSATITASGANSLSVGWEAVLN